MKLIILIYLTVGSIVGYAQNSKVLIVGDSWAQQQYSDLVHDAVFDVNGYPDIQVLRNADSDAGARDGTTAGKELLIIKMLGFAREESRAESYAYTGNDKGINFSSRFPHSVRRKQISIPPLQLTLCKCPTCP